MPGEGGGGGGGGGGVGGCCAPSGVNGECDGGRAGGANGGANGGGEGGGGEGGARWKSDVVTAKFIDPNPPAAALKREPMTESK